MSQDPYTDPYDTAASTTVGPKKYFGQLLTDAFYVYIKKEEPKEVFDPARHPASNKFTQIKIGAMCTKADGSTYDIDREIICEFGREWAGIVLPSLKKLNVHPRDLNDRWASWEMVENGQSWTSKTSGELVKGTTFKFSEFYADEAACRAAEAAFYNRGVEESEENLDDTHPMPEDDDKERASAAVFLPTLWKLAQGDPDAFYAAISNQPQLAKHFDSNSPEVQAIVAGAA